MSSVIADIYLDARRRIDDLVRPMGPGQLDRPTPCCPGWTVHGVVSHLVGTVEWSAEGRLRGIPSDDDTTAQVAERAGTPTVDLLDRWIELAPPFAAQAAEAGIWPAAIDVVTHEFDLRQAVGDRDARDHDGVATLAGVMVGSWAPPEPVEVRTAGTSTVVGGDDAELVLDTTDFELLRARLGRRSAAQLADLAWSRPPPAAVVASLCVFGPAAEAIDE